MTRAYRLVSCAFVLVLVAGCAARTADYGAATERDKAAMLKQAARSFREAARLDEVFRVVASSTDAAQDLVSFDARLKRGAAAVRAADAFKMKRATEIAWCADPRLDDAVPGDDIEVRVRVALGGDDFVDLNYGKRACAPYGGR